MEPTGEFKILNNDYVVAIGYIRPAKDNELQLQDLIDEFDVLDFSVTDDIKSNTKEFYRELRTRGYDYGPKFQRVVESKFIDTNKPIGKVGISNTTNFISYLDSMLQLMINEIPLNSLFVPLSIQSFKCDPMIFYEEVNKNKKYFSNLNEKDSINTSDELTKEKNISYKVQRDLLKQDLITQAVNEAKVKTVTMKRMWFYDVPVIIDRELKAIVAKGIEFRDVISFNLPRKFLSDGLRLERYEFIPFDEDNAIENYNKNGLLKYFNVCSAICKQILENKIFKVNIDHFVNYLKLIQVESS